MVCAEILSLVGSIPYFETIGKSLFELLTVHTVAQSTFLVSICESSLMQDLFGFVKVSLGSIPTGCIEQVGGDTIDPRTIW